MSEVVADETDADEDAETSGDVRTYTVHLELVDEPGELLDALEPIADSGGNLLSIHHERDSKTPRGHVPVEVDIECPPDRFDDLVDAFRDAGVNVVRAGAEQYEAEVSVVLVGRVVENDLSEILSRIEDEADALVRDLSLASPEGSDGVASARVRLAIDAGRTDETLSTVRSIGAEKDLTVVEPLVGGEA